MKIGRPSPEQLCLLGTVVLVSFAWAPTPHATEIKTSVLVTGTLLLAVLTLGRLARIRGLAACAPARWAVLAWLGLNWVSLVWSAFPQATLDRLTELTLLVVWAWLVMVNVRGRSELRLVLVAYLVCAVGVSVVALASFFSGATRVAVWPFGNPNFLAGYLLVPAGVSFGLLLGRRALPRRRMLAGAALVVVLLALWFTDSLSARLAAVVVLGVVGMGQLSAERRYRAAELVVGVGGLLGFLAAAIVYGLGAQGLVAFGRGVAVRGFFWKWSMVLFRQHPSLGSGAGTVFPSIMPVSNLDRFGHPGLFNPLTVHSHNEFLEVMVELGLVGLVVFLVMLYLLSRPLGRAWMRKEPGEVPGPELGLLASFLGLNLQACASVAPRFVEVGCFYWLAVGLLLAWPRVAGGAKPDRPVDVSAPRPSAQVARRLFLGVAVLVCGWLWYSLAWLPLRSAWQFGSGVRAGSEKDWVRAGEAFRQALSGRPRYADRVRLLNRLGDVERHGGRFAEASGYYREALRLAPGVAPVHASLANAVTLSGDVERGLDLYRQMALLAPGYPGLGERIAEVGAKLAESEQRVGRLDSAISHWREAVWLDPDEVEYHLRLAECLVEAGRGAEAEEELRRTAERFAEQREVRERVEHLRSRLPPQPESGRGGCQGD